MMRSYWLSTSASFEKQQSFWIYFSPDTAPRFWDNWSFLISYLKFFIERYWHIHCRSRINPKKKKTCLLSFEQFIQQRRDLNAEQSGRSYPQYMALAKSHNPEFMSEAENDGIGSFILRKWSRKQLSSNDFNERQYKNKRPKALRRMTCYLISPPTRIPCFDFPLHFPSTLPAVSTHRVAST